MEVTLHRTIRMLQVSHCEGWVYPLDQSYQQFLEFIDQRDKMKEHLDKQTESLNSLKHELDSLKKGSYEFGEKIRHGERQILPITRSKR
jgi:septal ring factor EnvC (AmiA/AmiB activator)